MEAHGEIVHVVYKEQNNPLSYQYVCEAGHIQHTYTYGQDLQPKLTSPVFLLNQCDMSFPAHDKIGFSSTSPETPKGTVQCDCHTFHNY
jgi:hypothetical protein